MAHNPHDAAYLSGINFIRSTGVTKSDRTGTGVTSTFGLMQKYDLWQGFPALTLKQLAWRAVVSELLWFIEGSGDERRLAEILHGTRDDSKRTIWTDNANAPYWIDKAQYPGDAGRIYGVQWRTWRQYGEVGAEPGGLRHVIREEIDQLKNVIEAIKKDPFSRRHIVTAWNPAEIDDMALPPCHIMFQFNVVERNGVNTLNCAFYQRSNDYFLGCPFNIASYSLLTHMVAQVCGLVPGVLTHFTGDAHIYSNHTAQVDELVSRESFEAPSLWLDPSITSIDDFKMEHIKLENYLCHPAIKAPMAV